MSDNLDKAHSGKKPVWVDEDAHAILKAYSKLTKASMVEVASTLVLRRLRDLDPASGLIGGGEGRAESSAAGDTAKPALALKPATQIKRAKRAVPDINDTTIRYVGGIWFV